MGVGLFSKSISPVGAWSWRLGLVVCLAALLCAGLAQSAELNPAEFDFIERHFKAAKTAEQAKDLATAAREYRIILEKYPRSVPEIYQSLGYTYFQQRQFEKAIATFEEGVKLKPNMVGARLFLGSSYSAIQKPEKAIPHFEYAHRNQPSAETAMFLGMAYTTLNRLEKAAEAFLFALNKGNDKESYLYLVGDTYLRLAENVANTLVRESPASPYSYFIKARIFDDRELHQLAAEHYVEAAKRDPKNAVVFYRLARSLAIIEFDDAAKLSLARYQNLVPLDRQVVLDPGTLPKQPHLAGLKSDYLEQLTALPAVDAGKSPLVPLLSEDVNDLLQTAVMTDNTGRWKSIVDLLNSARWQEAIEKLRSVFETKALWLRDFLIAEVYFWNENYVEAAETLKSVALKSSQAPPLLLLRWDVSTKLSFVYFKRLLDEFPDASWSHFVKARLLDAQVKVEALHEYRQAISKNPTQIGLRIALADYYLSNMNTNAALEVCQEELELNPDSAEAKERIGRVYVNSVRPKEAVPYLREVLKVDPKHGRVWADIGKAHQLLGEIDEAIAAYRRALELNPLANQLHYALGQIYLRRGEKELAKKELDIFQANQASKREELQERVMRFREDLAQSKGDSQ